MLLIIPTGKEADVLNSICEVSPQWSPIWWHLAVLDGLPRCPHTQTPWPHQRGEFRRVAQKEECQVWPSAANLAFSDGAPSPAFGLLTPVCESSSIGRSCSLGWEVPECSRPFKVCYFLCVLLERHTFDREGTDFFFQYLAPPRL